MKPPANLKPKGRGARRWEALMAAADFDEVEIELLAEFCADLDEIDSLPADAVVERRHRRSAHLRRRESSVRGRLIALITSTEASRSRTRANSVVRS